MPSKQSASTKQSEPEQVDAYMHNLTPVAFPIKMWHSPVGNQNGSRVVRIS